MNKRLVKTYRENNGRSITGKAEIDSAFLRLSHILREIAESTVNGGEEMVEIKSNTRAPQVRNSKNKGRG